MRAESIVLLLARDLEAAERCGGDDEGGKDELEPVVVEEVAGEVAVGGGRAVGDGVPGARAPVARPDDEEERGDHDRDEGELAGRFRLAQLHESTSSNARVTRPAPGSRCA